MVALAGWIGSILFMLCGLPQAILCFRQKHAKGVSWWFLILWLGGEVFTLIYVLPKKHVPLLVNYGFSIVVILIIIKYKMFPKTDFTSQTRVDKS